MFDYITNYEEGRRAAKRHILDGTLDSTPQFITYPWEKLFGSDWANGYREIITAWFKMEPVAHEKQQQRICASPVTEFQRSE